MINHSAKAEPSGQLHGPEVIMGLLHNALSRPMVKWPKAKETLNGDLFWMKFKLVENAVAVTVSSCIMPV